VASKVEFDRRDLKTPDAFFENVGRANRYVRENRRRVIAITMSILAVFVAAVVYHRWSERRADETAAAFLRATDALDLDGVATAKTALEGVAEHGDGIYGEMAVLYQADIAAREERWDDALAGYEDTSREGSTPYLRQIAMIGKGFVLERTGKAEEAAGAYGAAADISGPYREQALRDQLRTARVAGKADVAAAAINEILELNPEAPDADELAAQLGTPPAASD
jgi:hypothetical protein